MSENVNNSIIDKIYGFLDHFQSPLLLLIRLYWGWFFFVSGLGKFRNFDSTCIYFYNLGIPFPKLSAFLSSSTELVGGILQLIGLFARLASIFLVINMLVAYFTAHLDIVKNIFHDPAAFVSADPFLFLLAAAIVMAFGPGLFSVDALIGKVLHKPGHYPRHLRPAPG